MVCETVTVDVYDEQNNVVNFTVPAYTVEPSALKERVEEILADYLALSSIAGDSVSLGDFMLYLLPKAAADPKVQ